MITFHFRLSSAVVRFPSSILLCFLHDTRHGIFLIFLSLKFCLEIVGHNIVQGGGGAKFTCGAL
jgi:hypothetical protein